MKKRIALALAMAICLSLLCTVALADKVTVNFFHRWPNEPKNSYINSLIDEFEAANPDIDIVADCVLNDSYKEKIRVLVSTDALPDVFFSWSGVFGENLTRSGRVLALDDVMARDSEWSSQIVEGQWAPFNYNGKQYGLSFYRPPEGRFSEANLKTASEMGCKTVFWSFAYADWDNRNQMSPEKAMKKVLSHTHNGEVILLHPTSATNAEILDPLLTEWEKQGYRFGTLYELTADS